MNPNSHFRTLKYSLIMFIARLKFLYGQSVRFPASFLCLSFPVPFFVHCPYKGRINQAKGVLTGVRRY